MWLSITDNLIYLLFIIILLLFAFFFSGAEAAFFAANKFKLKHLARHGNKKAKLVLKYFEKPELFLSVFLIGFNTATIAASAIATILSVNLFGKNEQAVLITTGIVTLVFILLGELAPKLIATIHLPPEKSMLLSAPLIRFFEIIFYPVVKIMDVFSRLLIGRKKVSNSFFSLISQEELKTMILTGSEVPGERKKMLHRLLEMSETSAREIMVPRVNVFAVEMSISFDVLWNSIIEHRFTRIPVYQDNLENIIGIIHSKDVIEFKDNPDEYKIDKMLRKPLFVPDSTHLEQLLKLFKKEKSHLAIVVDEYGGFEGIVTLEDVIEEIVGEIQDEHDEEKEKIKRLGEDLFLVDGSVAIKDLNDTTGFNLPEEEYNIAGFILSILGKFPEKKEVISYPPYVLNIVKVKKNIIEKVRIKRQHIKD